MTKPYPAADYTAHKDDLNTNVLQGTCRIWHVPDVFVVVFCCFFSVYRCADEPSSDAVTPRASGQPAHGLPRRKPPSYRGIDRKPPSYPGSCGKPPSDSGSTRSRQSCSFAHCRCGIASACVAGAFCGYTGAGEISRIAGCGIASQCAATHADRSERCGGGGGACVGG
jgi:hypothetical protein